MFRVTRNGENRLDIAFSGKLDSEEMMVALDELEERSKNIKNGKMLYDVIDRNVPLDPAYKTGTSGTYAKINLTYRDAPPCRQDIICLYRHPGENRGPAGADLHV